MTNMTDAIGRQWLYGYDANGYRTHVADPQGNVTQFAYNSVGQTTQRQDALNRVTNYTLDGWGRVSGVAYPTTGNASLGFGYNAAGQLMQASDGTGVRTYQYNTLGQRTSMTDPRGNTSATYDNLGNLLTQTDVSGRQITNSPNTLGQLASVKDGSDNATAIYTYNVDGKINTATYPNGTKTTYGYDNAGRVAGLAHTNSSGNVLVGYAAQYDSGGRLTKVTEQPSGDVTAYTYDNASNLLTETRTGTKPYSGVYTYDQSNRRLTAKTIANGVVTHNGVYTYDKSGRLSQVVDSATTPATTELYAWNADGTMASYPGPQGSGYTRRFRYDEEQHLTGIAHDYGSGNVQLAYEYGYAADGGRRWQKDYVAGVWTWYPCGVACNAGELVEQTSDLTGSAWTTSALYLKSGSSCGAKLIRRNGEYHHFDIAGNLAIVTGNNASVLATRLYNTFSVQQYTTGSVQTPWTSSVFKAGAEGLTIDRCFYYSNRGVGFSVSCSRPPGIPIYLNCLHDCLNKLMGKLGVPEISLACTATAACCFAAPESVVCCPAAALCLGIDISIALAVVGTCIAKCAVDPVGPLPLLPVPRVLPQ